MKSGNETLMERTYTIQLDEPGDAIAIKKDPHIKIKLEQHQPFTCKKIKEGKEIYPIPDLGDKTKLNVKYPLIEPYAFVHIHWDRARHELVYELHEPELNQDEKKVLDI